ncbi:unnamed protein product, partial [Chrysoparadoxa australica]
GCGLGPTGVEALAEGLAGNHTLEQLWIAGCGPGKEGNAALGKAMLDNAGCKIKGITTDKWFIKPGQRELSVVVPEGGARTHHGLADAALAHTMSEEDMLLLAGALRPNSWLVYVALDGHAITSAGLEHLLTALRANRWISKVSLQRCHMDGRCASMLLNLLKERPGLAVLCSYGNDFSDDLMRKLAAADNYRRNLMNKTTVPLGGKIHLLGSAGAGKTTLSKALKRGYWASIMGPLASEENEEDRGADQPFHATRGIAVTKLALGDVDYSVWDYGGLQACRSMYGIATLGLPRSIYVIVVSLAASKQEQRSTLRYWLRLLLCFLEPGREHEGRLVVMGSRADVLGNVAGSYLEKLWLSTQSELGEKACASLPPLAGCVTADCRKSQSGGLQRLKGLFQKVEKEFNGASVGECPLLYIEVAKRVSEWKHQTWALEWPEFWKRLQQTMYPRLPEDLAVATVKALHAIGQVMYIGRFGCPSWVVLEPETLFSCIREKNPPCYLNALTHPYALMHPTCSDVSHWP